MTPADSTGIANLLEQHLNWYPLMEVQDVYKLLYQGVMGAEHLLASVEEFSHYLTIEYDSIRPDPALHLFEPVRTDGALFRINLRSLKSRQTGLEDLLTPLIQTAQSAQGTKQELSHTWEVFAQLCLSGFSRFDNGKLKRFTARLEKLEYPAMHHSASYRRAYQPSYRLIAAQFIRELRLSDGG
jgi:hypothetical protein